MKKSNIFIIVFLILVLASCADRFKSRLDLVQDNFAQTQQEETVSEILTKEKDVVLTTTILKSLVSTLKFGLKEESASLKEKIQGTWSLFHAESIKEVSIDVFTTFDEENNFKNLKKNKFSVDKEKYEILFIDKKILITGQIEERENEEKLLKTLQIWEKNSPSF
ncbi:MAG: hypothetical protein HYW47_07395 [Deltaproteobacteria bacterium]|nr:hypothetical protein [Deltaproteobacteria bacterium]